MKSIQNFTYKPSGSESIQFDPQVVINRSYFQKDELKSSIVVTEGMCTYVSYCNSEMPNQIKKQNGE